MDFIPKDRILETKPGILTAIRKQYNLEKPGQMKEAINILHEWVQKQKHFQKKDFSQFYLEAVIIGCKGSIERAKIQIDKICTMRTLLPQFFEECNVKTDLGDLHEIIYALTLPKLTDDYHRVFYGKYCNKIIKPTQIMDHFKYTIVLTEYVKNHDYFNGIIIILDFSEANLVDFLSKLSATELRQAMSINIEGYGLRVKAIHIISPSKVINTLVAILNQVLSSKVAGKIQVHKNIEELYKHIPKEILPKDCGGTERSLKDLQRDWLDTLSSEEHLNHMRVINAAGTNEDLRQKECFNDLYAGMPGTFRSLTVD
ncbi:uncharacterized protein LOC126775572 [Nymphalis io]|uniref:uncharacterized protein LOC126775572 n=1 Tax=Inachis io TaxID=171585 RepID=UPI00216879BB|nr:uncharacterized protein LOC126775572 [Nymphalis io]